MAIAVHCSCGQAYQLKDELAGSLVKCPACGAELRVAVPERRPRSDAAFDRDKFLLRQQHLAINEKYYVRDEQGGTILFVERPRFFVRSLVAAVAAVVVVLAFFAVGIALVVAIPSMAFSLWAIVVVLVVALFGGVAALAMWTWIMPKRHIHFYRDDSRRERLLEVLQDKKFWLWQATYSVRDAVGNPLASLHKNYLYNVIRKRWDCLAPNGTTLCVAREDSLILSLLRRFIGPLFGTLRTNFVILAGETDQIIGEFNRNFTLLDRYVLDLGHDPQRLLDRRVALALGVLLDTGEKR